MKVNDLRDIIVYYVRVNQDKEVNMKLTLMSVMCNGIRVSKFINVPCDMVESDGTTRIPPMDHGKIETSLIKRARWLGRRSEEIRGVTFIRGG